MVWDGVHRTLAVLWASSLIFASSALLAGQEAEAGEDRPEVSRTPPPVRDLPGISAAIDESDAATALDAIRITLSEVSDGGSYVWHRHDGRLSGMAQPTSSFKDASGQACRHLIVVLNTPDRSRKVEGIACQMADRRWQLTG
jgi:hypothetical protein